MSNANSETASIVSNLLYICKEKTNIDIIAMFYRDLGLSLRPLAKQMLYNHKVVDFNNRENNYYLKISQ